MGTNELTRRDFVKAGVAAGAGVLIAFYLPGTERFERLLGHDAPFDPNAWIRIGTDDTVTLVIDKSEMGQGVLTSLPMILADELGVPWTRIRVEQALATNAFARLRDGRQSTGGSTSVRTSWDPMRLAGAQAREMLVAAAAARWSVSAADCHALDGRVTHAPSHRSATYGELAAAAARLDRPAKPSLKEPSAYRLIGTSVPRMDTAAKTNGTARFGIDVKAERMLVAVIARSPVWGGTLAALDDTKARTVPGVRRIVPVSTGVAVVANGYWPARTARDALIVRWNEGANAGVATAEVWRRFTDRASQPGTVAYTRGDTPALTIGSRTVEAEYRLPWLAHATMEPMNCTAHVRGDGCDIWAPTQNQTAALDIAQRATGLPRDAIHVHTTFLGGGFGRRLEVDYVGEAVEVSKAVGAPVKVLYSREDDVQHDFYRPASLHRLSATLDAAGWPVSWTQRVTANSVLAHWAPKSVENGVDRDQIAGCGKDFPYAIPNMHLECAIVEAPVRVGWWRSVGHSSTAFVVEGFIDELAAAGGKDPLELRQRLLAGSPRHLAVLDLVTQKAGWGMPLPGGHAHGIALVDAFGSITAQVAEVSLEGGAVHVLRVICAIDCGRAVNPGIITAQVTSGIIFGLTAALQGNITVQNGRVQQSNFNDYPVLRINEVPQVEVHIVPSEEPPGGVGETGVPPIAPAVMNALFALTGTRVRELPIRL